MPVLTEGLYPGEYLISEVGAISRDRVTISGLTGGATYAPGTVLAQVESGGTAGTWTQYDPSTATIDMPGGILYAAAGNGPAVVTARLSEVRAADLVWHSGVDSGEKTAALAILNSTKNIVAR